MVLTDENFEEFVSTLRDNLLASLSEVLDVELQQFLEQHDGHEVYWVPKRIRTVLVGLGCFSCDALSVFTLERQDGIISKTLEAQHAATPPN